MKTCDKIKPINDASPKIQFYVLNGIIIVIIMLAALSGNCVQAEFAEEPNAIRSVDFTQTEVAEFNKLNSRQVVVVETNLMSEYRASLSVFELNESGFWQRCYFLGQDTIPAVIGRNGMSADKVEGDGCTPVGIYYIGLAFGYMSKIDSGLNYRQITENDYWVDDSGSPHYNRWIVDITTPAVSAEKMYRLDGLYKYGAVIEYNTYQPVVGKGSAIFLHIWRDSTTPTAGCAAISEPDILALLKWLNAEKNPVILIVVSGNRK